jgi:hypothetical protein
MGRQQTVLTWLAALLFSTSPTWAQEEQEEAAEETPGVTRVGLSPGEPQTRSAPPQVPVGIAPADSASNVFDFHGFILVPLNVGILKRENPGPGQGNVALHTPPQVPQYVRSFGWTGVIPDPWAQLNFSYGSSTVSGTVIFGTRSFTDAAGYFNPVDQLGVTDAFIAANLSKLVGVPLELKVGAVTGRYGPMGAYDAGRYGTPLIARTNSIGETITAHLPLGDFDLVLEQGAGGQLGAPPRGLVPSGWNDYADASVGASFTYHFHAGIGYKRVVQLGGHYIGALSADDRTTNGETVPDGRINVLGGDLRLTAGRGGHLYLGAAYTDLSESSVVSGVIEVLNARGGPEIIREYLGPNSGGNGSLMTFGGQYDLSFARLAFGDLYKGKSPDLRLSLFGVGTMVKSDDEDFDGTTKLKVGGEATYSVAKWFGASARFDHVRPNFDINNQSYHIISPRLLFHTDWDSREELVLQYSRFMYGDGVIVRTGFPPEDDPTAIPDEHVFTLSGTYWW